MSAPVSGLWFVAAGHAHEYLGTVLDSVESQLGAQAASMGLWRIGRARVRFVGRQWADLEGCPGPLEVLVVRASQTFGSRAELAAHLAEVDS